MTGNRLPDGFYPALGTPTDSCGRLIKESYNRQIELMIGAGCQGVLCMGSMGNMVSIRDKEYAKIARYCFKAVAGRVPFMVGVMDCSVLRVSDRIEALGDIKIDGVVATVPYYYKINSGDIINFYKMLSRASRYPVYIYDLPSVTQSPVTIEVIKDLIEEQNIKGIKTANLGLILEMQRNNIYRNDLSVLYSGLDLFDIAINSGIRKNLDGMFTCTPINSKRLYENIGNGDKEIISKCLNNILMLRNLFLRENIFSAYSYAMGLLGCPGNYHPDYEVPVSENLKEEIKSFMKTIKEI